MDFERDKREAEQRREAEGGRPILARAAMCTGRKMRGWEPGALVPVPLVAGRG